MPPGLSGALTGDALAVLGAAAICLAGAAVTRVISASVMPPPSPPLSNMWRAAFSNQAGMLVSPEARFAWAARIIWATAADDDNELPVLTMGCAVVGARRTAPCALDERELGAAGAGCSV